MSRNTQQVKGIAWDAVIGATGYNVHMDETDDAQFLPLVDAGEWPVFAEVDVAQFLFEGLIPEGADFAVVAIDDGGRFSDPHQPAAWNDIPLGSAPLAAPTGGRLLFD